MHSILTPVLVVVALTLVMALVMVIIRPAAMSRMGLTPQDARHTKDLKVLPSAVRQISDNYNHLLEQPTAFYALVFYVHLVGHADPLNVQLAWAYAILRVVHSLIQATVNVVVLRFSVFLLGTAALAVMAGRELLALL